MKIGIVTLDGEDYVVPEDVYESVKRTVQQTAVALRRGENVSSLQSEVSPPTEEELAAKEVPDVSRRSGGGGATRPRTTRDLK